MAVQRYPHNLKLRAVRETELRMYRHQLADALTPLVRHRDPHHNGVTPTMVKSWERGEAHPRGIVLDALCDLTGHTPCQLGVPPHRATSRPRPGPADPQRDQEQEDDVRRRQLTAGVIALAGLPVLGPLAKPAPRPTPRKIGQREIDRLNNSAEAFNALGNTRGGGFARAAVAEELEWAGELLRLPCPAARRDDLLRAVGLLALTGGFNMFDDHDHANATRVLKFGLACAEEAGDWSLRAKILSHLSRQATLLRNPDQALTYVELAGVRADRLGHVEQAMLATLRAAAHAATGRRQDTLRALGEADEHFHDHDPADTPPWMAFYTTPQHLGDGANALFTLEMSGGKRTQARERYAACVAGYSDAYARSRAMAQARLARLTLATGDPQEGVAIGQQAAAQVGDIHSRRAVDDLRALAADCRLHPEAADLREEIATRVGV